MSEYYLLLIAILMALIGVRDMIKSSTMPISIDYAYTIINESDYVYMFQYKFKYASRLLNDISYTKTTMRITTSDVDSYISGTAKEYLHRKIGESTKHETKRGTYTEKGD